MSGDIEIKISALEHLNFIGIAPVLWEIRYKVLRFLLLLLRMLYRNCFLLNPLHSFIILVLKLVRKIEKSIN